MAKPPLSDHFNGRRFFNPTLPRGFVHTRIEVMRMLLEQHSRRSRWPAFVENVGVLRLDIPLGVGDVAITFINHATFLIQTGGVTILTDPIWSRWAGPLPGLGPRRVRAAGVAFDSLPKIDLILLTHNHYDHLDLATLKRLRQRFDPVVLVARGDARLVGPLGFSRLHELDWWDEFRLGDALKMTFAPTQHFSARGPFDERKSLWGAYMIETHDRRIYFGGDSGYSSHFSDTRARLGPPDIALLSIGAYAPRWFMTPIHMNPAEAVRAHGDLGARQSIGMHFGTFQLTTDPIDQPLADLKCALVDSGVSDQAFHTLHEGETRVYPKL